MNLFYIILISLSLSNLIVNCEIFNKTIKSAKLNESIIAEKLDLLPSIYHIDDYNICKNENKLFCQVSVKLNKLQNKNSIFWDVIQELKKTKNHYNHDELFHAICVENFCPHINLPNNINESLLIEKLSKCYSDKFYNLGLNATVIKISFHNENGFPVRFIDMLILAVVILYIAYIAYSTIYDMKNKFSNPPTFFEQTWILPFSIKHNWNKLNESNNSEDFRRLKCIQGIRFYNMLIIIFCHTFCTYIGGYTLNTVYYEDIHLNSCRLFIRNLLLFLVHTFFLISGFFLSYHNFQLMEQQKEFQIKQMLLQFLNRYLRVLPPVIVIVILSSTVWVMNRFTGPIKDLYSDQEFIRCQKNWWATMLFISNHYNHDEMCCFITWYLSADTQLYAFSLIILSFIWKFKHFAKQIITFFILMGIVIQAIVVYIYNLDVIYRITPENSKNDNFRSFPFNASYTSTYTNMATFMVGLGFGLFYYKYKNCNIKTTITTKISFYVIFISLPILVVFTTFFEYPKIPTAILAGILKPIFAIGIAIGIFGMSYNFGGVLKSVCEWKFAVFMGNFTFSTYLAHYGIVFSRVPSTTETRYVSDYVLAVSFLRDIILSFVVGFIMYIFVEKPISLLQNKFIPQVRRNKKTK